MDNGSLKRNGSSRQGGPTDEEAMAGFESLPIPKNNRLISAVLRANPSESRLAEVKVGRTDEEASFIDELASALAYRRQNQHLAYAGGIAFNVLLNASQEIGYMPANSLLQQVLGQ